MVLGMTPQTVRYNQLETVYLVTSLFILLAGMAFESGVAVAGTGPHSLLTYLVAIVLVISGSLFIVILALEVRHLPTRAPVTGPPAILHMIVTSN